MQESIGLLALLLEMSIYRITIGRMYVPSAAQVDSSRTDLFPVS